MAARRLLEVVESNFPLELIQGVTYSVVMTYYDSTGSPVNLTGKVLYLNIKNIFPDLLSIDSETGPSDLGSYIDVTDTVNGVFRIEISAEETATAESDVDGKWWLEIEDGDERDPIWVDCVTVAEI